MYVTIDPGLQSGWALWSIAGLVACGLGDPRTCPEHRVTVRGKQDTVDDVWIEKPVIYPRSKARPADIVTLAVDAGRWAGRYDMLAVEVHFVEPAAWKGQVPKDIHHARVWAALNDDERDVVTLAGRGMAPSKRHNMLDAVGLGLWVRSQAGR